jgi:Subtilase family/Dickkopf N-terminal cysteine-rich region
MNSRKYFSLALIILLSTMVYALDFSNNEIDFKDESLVMANTNLDTFVYAGVIDKSTGEKIVVKKRMSDIIVSSPEIEEDKNVHSFYMKRIQDSFKDVDLRYDERIIKRFEDQSFVHVSVKLHGKSNVLVKGTKEEEWFNQEIDKVLSDFSRGGFDLIIKGSNFFEGDISEKDFEKLLKDSRVKSVKDYTGVQLAKAQLDESVSIINVDNEVWNLGYSGGGVKVCVIDTGINTGHPDLSGNIVDEKCYCSNDCCPDNTDEDDSAEDDNGHGTHVAGIIASQDSTYKGVAYNADLYIVKVLDSNGDLASYNDVDNAIEWCEDQGVDIISMSFGTDTVYTPSNCPSWSETEINNAYNSGIFIDASSGNGYSFSGISYPACSSNVVSVGATTKSDDLASYTNRYTTLDLLAPGSSITSLFLGGGTATASGTSVSAPHVAGAAALLLEVDGFLMPDEIKNTLMDTGVYVDGYPRINVLAAINSLTEEGEEGELSSCAESGYEECIEYKYGNCDVSIAVNHYENVNNIRWGAISDSSDPYVLGDYVFGWKDVDARNMYYDVDNPNGGDCYLGGCDGESVADEGTRATVSAPGTAHREIILGYDETSSYYCWVYFNDFNPSYTGGANPIYVLNCFDDDDCSVGEYCDKSGSWSNWDCVSDESNGQLCTRDAQCSSGYCDNDGVGLSDDGWCFTPYNTYFDGQENTKCEISTNLGDANCDERYAGEDLNLCVGITYYEEECSSTCSDNQDVISVFECTDAGCFCDEPLCDGLAIGGDIAACSAGYDYFADKCTSTASGEDRGNDICRSSVFAFGCSADVECDGVEAGTGGCYLNCSYDGIPRVEVVDFEDGYADADGIVMIYADVVDDNLKNASLYLKSSGVWELNESINLSGEYSLLTFTKILDDGDYEFYVDVYDNDFQRTVSGNFSFSVNRSLPVFEFRGNNSYAVAWFDGFGSLNLKGNCSISVDCVAPQNSLIFQDVNKMTVAYIDGDGNICLESESCNDNKASCNPSEDAFIVQNGLGLNLSYVDFSGEMCLIGELNEEVYV